MKVQPFTGTRERTILIGMIVSHSVLAKLTPKWQDKMFSQRYANLIANWCISHFKKLNEPPLKSIVNHFEKWSTQNKDQATFHLIDDFLQSLSDEYESSSGINADHVLDLATEHFNEVLIDRHIEQLQSDRDSGDIPKALERISTFGKVDMITETGYDLFTDPSELAYTFSDTDSEILITYPGALGQFFRDALSRDSFVSFVAPEKTGKTWMLIDVAFRGLLQRRRVAFFSVGDMSRRQINRRLFTRAAKHPWRSETGDWPYLVQYPTKITRNKNGDSLVEHKVKTFNQPLDIQIGKEALRKLAENQVKSKDSYFKMYTCTNSTMGVHGIQGILDTWKASNWEADVVVIDYADILMDPPGQMEYRDKINYTWKQLRALSQRQHCLVVTATQSDAAGYDQKVLTKKNFSEDKRKNAHVTAMIGINVNAREKDMGAMRLNWVDRREGEFNPYKCVHIAGCLPLANPCIHSTW